MHRSRPFAGTPGLRSLASALLLFALLAGCGPSFRILRQTNPTPLRGAREFAVAPTQFAGATVDMTSPIQAVFGGSHVLPVEVYLAQRGAPLQAIHDSMLARLNRPPRRAGAAAGPPPPGVFVIQTRLTRYRPEILVPRSYGTGSRPATAEFLVQFFTAQGRLLDEIQIEATEVGLIEDTMHPEPDVLWQIGEDLGAQIARYLDERSR